MPESEQRRKVLAALGNRIREARVAKHLTQRALADAMGRDRQSLFRLERGMVNPGYILLLELCEALDVDIADLLKGISNN